jgi:hypothetical protein
MVRWSAPHHGIDGVGAIAKGDGRKVQRVVEFGLTGKPLGGATRWTTGTLAARVAVGKETVAQIWTDHQLQP